jgi:hypothetical protein
VVQISVILLSDTAVPVTNAKLPKNICNTQYTRHAVSCREQLTAVTSSGYLRPSATRGIQDTLQVAENSWLWSQDVLNRTRATLCSSNRCFVYASRVKAWSANSMPRELNWTNSKTKLREHIFLRTVNQTGTCLSHFNPIRFARTY